MAINITLYQQKIVLNIKPDTHYSGDILYKFNVNKAQLHLNFPKVSKTIHQVRHSYREGYLKNIVTVLCTMYIGNIKHTTRVGILLVL